MISQQQNPFLRTSRPLPTAATSAASALAIPLWDDVSHQFFIQIISEFIQFVDPIQEDISPAWPHPHVTFPRALWRTYFD